MRPTSPVVIIAFLALLMLMTAGVIAISEGQTTTAEVVDPGDEIERFVHGKTADFGHAATTTQSALTVEYEHRAFVQTVLERPPDERESLLEAYLETFEAELHSLFEDDQTALEAYRDHALETDWFVKQLILTGVIADARQSTLDDLENLDGEFSGVDLEAASTDLSHRYGQLDGPVRDRLLLATIDPTKPTTVGIATANSGLALTAADETRFHRETVRFDRLDTTHIDEFDLARAETIAVDTYPSTTKTIATRDLGDGLYRIDRAHHNGTVTAYITASTEAVAIEHQSRWLDSIGLSESGSTTELGIEVTLERSFEDGPLRVTSTDAGSGEGIDASVYLRHDGTWSRLGTTDADGAVWSADPGGPIDVRVVTPDGTITLSVQL